MRARRWFRGVAVAIAVTSAAASGSTGGPATPAGEAAPAQAIEQPDLGFTLRAPEGFERVKPPNAAGLYAFKRTLPDQTAIIVSVDKMGGTIDRRRYKPEELIPAKFSFPANAKMSLQAVTWRSFTLDAFRVELPTDGPLLVVFVCQVPLAPEAVQLTVVGAQSHETEANEVFRALVDSVDGKSNWLSDSERSYKLGLLVGRVVGAALGVAVILLIVRARRKRT